VTGPVATGKTLSLSTMALNYSAAFNHSSTGFYVCYTEGDGSPTAPWVNSGIRLTISKVYSVGSKPITIEADNAAGALTHGEFSVGSLHQDQSSPETAQFMPLEYNLPGYLNTLHIPTPESAWVSFVAVYLSSNTSMGAAMAYNPCATGDVAAQLPDNLHSGPQLATNGNFTIPQDPRTKTFPATTIIGDSHHTITLEERTTLDETKIFAMCYAHGNGTTQDETWRDSLVRFRFKDLTPPKIIASKFDYVGRYTDGRIEEALKIAPNITEIGGIITDGFQTGVKGVMVDGIIVLRFDESVRAGNGYIRFKPMDGQAENETRIVAANDTTQVDFSCRDLLPECPEYAHRGMCTPNIGELPSFDFSTKICQKSCGNCSVVNTGNRMTDSVSIDLTARLDTVKTNYSILIDADAFTDDALEPNFHSGYVAGNMTFQTRDCPTLCCDYFSFASVNCTCVSCIDPNSWGIPECQFWNDYKAYQRCEAYLPCHSPLPHGCGPNYFLGWHRHPAYRPDEATTYVTTAGTLDDMDPLSRALGQDAPVILEPQTTQLNPRMP